jgi:hypothetical protein
MPDGWQWAFNSEDGDARVWRRWPSGQVEEFVGKSKQPAIALCIASLEARERAAQPIMRAWHRIPAMTGNIFGN